MRINFNDACHGPNTVPNSWRGLNTRLYWDWERLWHHRALQRIGSFPYVALPTSLLKMLVLCLLLCHQQEPVMWGVIKGKRTELMESSARRAGNQWGRSSTPKFKVRIGKIIFCWSQAPYFRNVQFWPRRPRLVQNSNSPLMNLQSYGSGIRAPLSFMWAVWLHQVFRHGNETRFREIAHIKLLVNAS